MAVFDALVAGEDGDPDEDLSSMTPEMRRRFAQDLREALSTYAGIALDNLAVGRPWDVDVGVIRQPTFLWYGECDKLVSDVYPRWWQEQIPHARLTMREGKGHGSAYLGIS